MKTKNREILRESLLLSEKLNRVFSTHCGKLWRKIEEKIGIRAMLCYFNKKQTNFKKKWSVTSKHIQFSSTANFLDYIRCIYRTSISTSLAVFILELNFHNFHGNSLPCKT